VLLGFARVSHAIVQTVREPGGWQKHPASRGVVSSLVQRRRPRCTRRSSSLVQFLTAAFAPGSRPRSGWEPEALVPATNRLVMGWGSPVTPARNGGSELVPNQRKRVGRLRLLVAALVVTSISVVGAAGTASAVPKPKPSRGVLEICKAVAGDEKFSGTFGFKVQGVNGVVQVPVGYCSLPIKLSPGTVTVTEVQRPGYRVHSITAVGPANDNRLHNSDPVASTATVGIVAGGAANQTMLTFTNKVIPKGYLEVCKDKPRKDKLDGYASFTVAQLDSPPQTVSVRVGACSMPIQLNPGLATITEVANSGAQLVDIEVTPEERWESENLASRSVTVEIVPGGRSAQTMVTFINKKKVPPPTKGFVKICKRAGRGVHNGTPFTFTLGSKTLHSELEERQRRRRAAVGDRWSELRAAGWLRGAHDAAPCACAVYSYGSGADRRPSEVPGNGTDRGTRDRCANVDNSAYR
jgi:hypothetical protein